MKPKLTLLCATILLFGALTGCNKKNNNKPNHSETTVTETTAAESETNTETKTTNETEGGSTETEQPGTETETEQPGTETETEEPGTETETEEPGTETETEEPGTETETEEPGTETETGGGSTETEEPPVGDKYQVTFGSGSSIKGYTLTETTLDEDDVKCEVVKKYVVSNLNVKAGDPIKFYLNEEEIQPGDEKTNGKDNGNNTLGDYPNYTVRQDATNASLYLKTYAEGYSFWLTGYEKPVETGPHGPEGSEHVEWYIVGQGSLWEDSWNVESGVQMYSNPSNIEDKGCILNITFEEGDLFKIVNGNSWYGYDKVNTGESEENAGIKAFEGVSDGYSGQNIKCKTAGTYAIYIQSTGLFWITNYAE